MLLVTTFLGQKGDIRNYWGLINANPIFQNNALNKMFEVSLPWVSSTDWFDLVQKTNTATKELKCHKMTALTWGRDAHVPRTGLRLPRIYT